MTHRRANSSKRIHIVLIPGFGGFDALGTVRYYSGITQLFQDSNPGHAVLHYFDNLPTAAVQTRAVRLQQYLAKRVARGEIIPEQDEIVLVGHSTGGLDIRQLLLVLAGKGRLPIEVDGGVEIGADEVLGLIHRVVFLSVPHWGTNIADWVRSHSWLREAVIRYMQGAVAGSQMYVFDDVEQRFAGLAARITHADILRAFRDCLIEANECYGAPGPTRTSEAHETAADLELYLRDMSSDFHVIEDLTAERPMIGPRSPAHFSDDERENELRLWEDLEITALSFATVGHRPYRFNGGAVPVWDPANPLAYAEVLTGNGPATGTDIAYRLCYRACAGGPLQWPNRHGKITRFLEPTPPQPLMLWDNDGIVNTVSMLWPKGEIVLVLADHLDVAGHYHLVPSSPPGSGRKYQSYDSLRSGSHFDKRYRTFEKVWKEAFGFCVGEKRRFTKAA